MTAAVADWEALVDRLNRSVEAAQAARASAAELFTVLSCGHGTTTRLTPGQAVSCHGEGHAPGISVYPVRTPGG